MLTLSVLNAIKANLINHFTDSDDGVKEAFYAASPEEQVAVLHDICKRDPHTRKITDEVLGAFILVLRVKQGHTKPNSTEHYELRDKLVGPMVAGWHKDHPPKNPFEMMDPNRVPSWTEEFMKCGAMARELAFSEASDPVAISMVVRHVLGLGGYEDVLDTRVAGVDDPTMQLFIQAVQQCLVTLRPEWHEVSGVLKDELETEELEIVVPEGTPEDKLDATVESLTGLALASAADRGQFAQVSPTGSVIVWKTDPRSIAEIELEQAVALAAKRADERRKLDEERRAAAQAKYNSEMDTLVDSLRADAETNEFAREVVGLATSLASLSFDEARELIKADAGLLSPSLLEDAAAYSPAIDPILADLSETTKAAESEVSEAEILDAKKNAGARCEQAVLRLISRDQPDWFRVLVNGDLTLRRGIGARPTGVTRAQRAIRNHIEADIAKYGIDEVLTTIRSFFDIDGTITQKAVQDEEAEAKDVDVDTTQQF